MSVFIAEQKKKENIAEYILYMWQVEDMIRAVGLDMEKIEEYIINQFEEEKEDLEKEREWFRDLARKLKEEGKEEQGHLEEVNDILIELYYLHNTLMNVMGDEKYKRLFEKASPHITELRNKSKGEVRNEIETCLHGLYGLLILRLKEKEISQETKESMETFSKVMAYLSQQYKRMKAGELNFNMN